MKRILKTLLLINWIVCLCMAFIFVLQGAPKGTTFTHTVGLAHNKVGPPGAQQWNVVDAAFIAFNPNASSNTIKFTVTAVNNPNFRFGSIQCPGAIGSCNWQVSVAAYNSCLNHTTIPGYAMFCWALDCASEAQGEWTQTFDIKLETLNNLAFYFYGPGDGFGAGAQDATPEAAFQKAWQQFDDDVPVEWDSDIQKWVAPFANFYHHHNEWPKGWQTEVKVTNSSGSALTYTTRNHRFGGAHGHDPNRAIPGHGCCNDPGPICGLCDRQHSYTTMCNSFSVPNGSTETKDAFRFHIDDENARTNHDSQLAVEVSSNNPNGSTVTVRVFPNDAGTVCMPCNN